MYNTEQIFDLYINARRINKEVMKYLKKCKITLLKARIINLLKIYIDPNELRKINKMIDYFINELKSDQFDLKTYKKIIYFANKNCVDEFDLEFAQLLKCIQMKDENIGEFVDYNILNLTYIIGNINCINPNIVEDESSLYNEKMNELSLKINNSLDKK